MTPSISKAAVGLTLLSLTSPSLAQIAGQSLGLTGSTGAGTAGAPAIGGQNVQAGPGAAAPGQGTPAQLAQASAAVQALSSIVSSVAASAQTQIPLFLLNTDPQPIVANVVAAPNADTTTFAIGCATGLPQGLCALPANPPMQVEHISGSVVRASVTVTQGDNISLSWACTLTTAGSGKPAIPTAVKGWGNPSANAAVCTTSVGVGSGVPPPPAPTGTITLTGTDVALAFLKVAVTSGSEKLAATASASANSTTAASTTAATTGSSTSSSMAAGMTGMAGAGASNSTAKTNATATGGTSGAGKIGGSGLGLSALSAVVLGSLLYAL